MRIFLSHSSRDKPLVREICRNLPDHVRTWIDERTILIGDDIEASIRAAIGTQIDLVLIFVGSDSVRSTWVRKELKWALERERELARSFVLPILLDDESWDLLPKEFRQRKYIKCTDLSEAGVKTTAQRLEEELFAWASRELEQVHRRGNEISRATVDTPKRSVEALGDVLKIYYDMSNKTIHHVLGELFEELEAATIPAGEAGKDYVLKVVDNYVQQLDGEHRESSSKADKMREDLANEADEKKKEFISTLGLMVEGDSMAAKLTRNHLLKLRRRFEIGSRNASSGELLKSLRKAADQLETESEVAGSRAIRPVEDLQPVDKPRIVGRTPERVRILEQFKKYEDEDDANRRARFVSITGKPGEGKTALAESVIAELRERGKNFRLGRGRCATKWKQSEAYLPFVRVLKTLLREEDDGAVATFLKRPESLWNRVLSLHQATPRDLGIVVREHRLSDNLLKAEMHELLTEVSRDKPLMLFFDDLHWADESTLQLLLYLVRIKCPAFILATFRPLESESTLKTIRHEAVSRTPEAEIILSSLREPDVEEYIFREHLISQQVAILVHEKSNGKPLFMTGLLEVLLSDGLLELFDNRWDFIRPQEEFASDLPSTMEQVISRRFDLLNADDRRVLRACSIRGQHFETAPVANALRTTIGMLPEDSKNCLNRLAPKHSFVETDDIDKELPDGTKTARYRFIHVEYQQWIYESIEPRQRELLSVAMANALLECYGEITAILSEVAQLLHSGREWHRALTYCVLAAEREALVSVRQEAGKMAERGLECVNKLREKGRADEYLREEAKLLNIQGRSIMVVEGYAGCAKDKLRDIFERGIVLSKLLQDQPSLYDTKFGLWNNFIVSGMISKAREVCHELQEISRDLAPDYGRLSEYALGLTLLQSGSLSEAERHLAIADPSSTVQEGRASITYGFHDDRIMIKAHLARAQWFHRDPQKARETVEEALTKAIDIGDPVGEEIAHFYAADICCLSGAVTEGSAHLKQVFEIGGNYNLPENVYAHMWNGWIIAQGSEVGKVETAVYLIESGLKACGELGIRVGETKVRALLAEIMKNSNDAEWNKRALACVEEGINAAEETGERYYMPELYRIKAELISKEPRRDSEAEKWFKTAKDLAVGTESKSLEIRVAASFANFLRDRGRAA